MSEMGQLFRFDGIEVLAFATPHSLKRNVKRDISIDDVWNTLLNANITLLDAKNGENVVVRDYLSGLQVVYSLETENQGKDILIHVITVFDGTSSLFQGNNQSTVIVFPERNEDGEPTSEYFYQKRMYMDKGQLVER